ncbi:hypothetical protein [Blastococcus sp. CT_GayMR16]|uniref:hypothetical protein n=1 Tax=Blastococcus sp. CT_GayMR16 TaxID=2559607 RepID=UPI0010735F83|nr:hypothetical protein [Blastococcus sp. CT_GayMR16]TFV91374.1 hypothetical protein E4P38_01955 [Blastococcus sp. CT_GayMR16]
MPTPLRRLADNLIEGGVDRFVTDRRKDGKSWRAIALDLRDTSNGQLDITPETVRGWYREATTGAVA